MKHIKKINEKFYKASQNETNNNKDVLDHLLSENTLKKHLEKITD